MAILILESLSLSSKLKDRKPGWRLRFGIFLKSQRNQKLFLTQQLRQNEQCRFAHGRDTVPIFILKTAFPCTEGITKRGWDPGHSQSQKLVIPSQFCRKSCVVFSLSPCPVISPLPLPAGARGAHPALAVRERAHSFVLVSDYV